jgi:hypothetical protein
VGLAQERLFARIIKSGKEVYLQKYREGVKDQVKAIDIYSTMEGGIMKERILFRRGAGLALLCSLLFFLTGCNTTIFGGGQGKIDFQPGVKDWNLNPLNIVSDVVVVSGNFGPPIWQGASAEDVRGYGLYFSSSYLSVRNAKEADGMTLANIWSGYSPKIVDSAGVILTAVYGYCVVDYNWSVINSVPGTIASSKGPFKCRILLYSTPVGGGNYNDKLVLTIYNYPDDTSDQQQLNITIENNGNVTAFAIARP